ncbi:hypothetical protein L1987_47776 [Smallanthus sonchifolius]|uniref:Uncharacterized protein n=1 Tax=Smallanthus sonchifolius TaxID=185202 RepID=A0ACB9FQY8_9ASTR|nr:hypothetical protein L1987_47776 [Smallanthus sonchifolius]
MVVSKQNYEDLPKHLRRHYRPLGMKSCRSTLHNYDRQKGLIPALSRVFPSAEHRFCLRHIHENMRKQWRGDVFKNMLWRAASATTMPFYDKAMDEIKRADKTLFEWLNKVTPQPTAERSGRDM